MALSATVLAGAPAPAGAAAPRAPVGSLVAAGVRFEPVDAAPGGLTVAGRGSYRGALEVRRNGGSLAVVNEVGLEDYVRGIDEVPASWPAAVLQAQAIAARTYVAHKAADPGDTPWRAVGADICATPRCQVYNGLDAERQALGQGWAAAVRATAGRVLLDGGRPILASYSSTANGPRAMSQNGALEMANQGRSAAEILIAYYGVAPSLAPGRLPATVRVALDTAAATARVSGAGAFRIVDERGEPLAESATGDWRVVPEGGGVRLVPPDGQAAVAAGVAEPALPVARRATRALVATTPASRRIAWAVPAVVLLAGTGTASITLRRRRRA